MKTTATMKTVQPPLPAPVTTVTLHMTGDQADTLAVILRKIGGHPNGRRGDTTEVLRALEEAGVAYHGPESAASRSAAGSIVFTYDRDGRNGGGC